MNTDKNINQHSASSQKKCDDILGELESIRHLLSGETPLQPPHDENPTLTGGHIPLLIPDDSIPTLGPEHRHRDNTASHTHKTTREKHLPATTQNFLSPMRSREKLVDDVVRSAMPRLEAILRELIQEALLQDKLRGGKR